MLAPLTAWWRERRLLADLRSDDTERCLAALRELRALAIREPGALHRELRRAVEPLLAARFEQGDGCSTDAIAAMDALDREATVARILAALDSPLRPCALFAALPYARDRKARVAPECLERIIAHAISGHAASDNPQVLIGAAGWAVAVLADRDPERAMVAARPVLKLPSPITRRHVGEVLLSAEGFDPHALLYLFERTARGNPVLWRLFCANAVDAHIADGDFFSVFANGGAAYFGGAMEFVAESGHAACLALFQRVAAAFPDAPPRDDAEGDAWADALPESDDVPFDSETREYRLLDPHPLRVLAYARRHREIALAVPPMPRLPGAVSHLNEWDRPPR